MLRGVASCGSKSLMCLQRLLLWGCRSIRRRAAVAHTATRVRSAFESDIDADVVIRAHRWPVRMMHMGSMRSGCLRASTVQLMQLRLGLLQPVHRCTHGRPEMASSQKAIVHDVAK